MEIDNITANQIPVSGVGNTGTKEKVPKEDNVTVTKPMKANPQNKEKEPALEVGKDFKKPNNFEKYLDRHLKFELHEETGRMVLKVYYNGTSEVIKEIPPHEMLDMQARIQEAIGVFLDIRS